MEHSIRKNQLIRNRSEEIIQNKTREKLWKYRAGNYKYAVQSEINLMCINVPERECRETEARTIFKGRQSENFPELIKDNNSQIQDTK